MAYPTTAALVAASATAELVSLTGAQQAALREMAIIAVERYCGQKFLPTVGSISVDGSGADEIHPTQRVEALTGITVKGTSLDLSDVTLSPEGDRLFIAALSTDYAVAAMRDERSWDSRTFRSGPGTVILTGTFGWTAPPAAVEQALRLDMEEQAVADASSLSGIVASSRRLGIRNISQGNLRAEVGVPDEVSPQVARLLSAYVWAGGGGYAL